MLSGAEFRLLRVFLEHPNRVLNRDQLLNLTQSALSHQIKLLEDRYGGPLFERKSVPIGFTATGARLAFRLSFTRDQLGALLDEMVELADLCDQMVEAQMRLGLLNHHDNGRYEANLKESFTRQQRHTDKSDNQT
mgnify:CR=1 FL=1